MTPAELAGLLQVLPADWRRFELSGVVSIERTGQPLDASTSGASPREEQVNNDLIDLGLGALVKTLKEKGG